MKELVPKLQLPLITENEVYTAKLFVRLNRPPQPPNIYVTVADSKDDLKFCEEFNNLTDAFNRISQIEMELKLDDLVE